MTSTFHGVCDSKGGPPAHLREGQCSDFIGDDGVLKDLPPAGAVIGGQGYERDRTRKMLARQGIPPCIPPRRCRKQPVHDHKRLDPRCRKIEMLFSRLKNWRRLATRYDVCAHVFRSATLLTLGKVNQGSRTAPQ